MLSRSTNKTNTDKLGHSNAAFGNVVPPRTDFRHWYVIFCKSDSEESLCRKIQFEMGNSLEYTLLVPKMEKLFRDRERPSLYKPMFPGYVIAATDDIDELTRKIRHFDKLYKVLRDGEDNFAEITIDEIAYLIYNVKECGVLGESKYYIEGDSIVVTDGPLKYFNGLVKSVRKRERIVRVEFKFAGRTVLQWLPATQIEPLGDGYAGGHVIPRAAVAVV